MGRVPAKRYTGYSIVTLGAAVAVVSFVTTLQLSAAPPQDLMLFDRTLKGDRLQVVPGATGAKRSRPDPALPKGCLALADGHRDIFSAEVPGRCVA
jgi:hypothetical protein